MIARFPGFNIGIRPRAAACVLGCLLLAVCAPAAPTHWVKTGADEAATAQEMQDCQGQANGVLAREQGIDQDISATLGGNWQLSNTRGLETESMNRSAAGAADQALDNCMRAKGFTKI